MTEDKFACISCKIVTPIEFAHGEYPDLKCPECQKNKDKIGLDTVSDEWVSYYGQTLAFPNKEEYELGYTKLEHMSLFLMSSIIAGTPIEVRRGIEKGVIAKAAVDYAKELLVEICKEFRRNERE